MKYVCITGGIGTGKSYVCKCLSRWGIKVYDCDKAAKRLMNESIVIKEKIINLVGENAYKEDRLNKPVIAKFLLSSDTNRQKINSIVHPAVIDDFYSSGEKWMESAILYDAHLEKYVDVVIAVTAPYDVRIRRIMQRDNISAEQAEEWIMKQMPQDEIVRRADYTIVNDGIQPLDEQINAILNSI